MYSFGIGEFLHDSAVFRILFLRIKVTFSLHSLKGVKWCDNLHFEGKQQGLPGIVSI